MKKPHPNKPKKQTPRQREIQNGARAYVRKKPDATLEEIAQSLGITKSRLSWLRKHARIVVEIPHVDAHNAKSVDGTRMRAVQTTDNQTAPTPA